jgi:hypothetical protein
VPLTKTTTRAFAASLVMVAAGGTIAGAAVFHLPILGLGRADVASASAAPVAKRAVPVAPKKVHPKVIVKTRYADQIVHVPAPSVASSATPVAAAVTSAPAQPPAPSPDPVGTIAEPEETTTTPPSPSTTVAEHDDEGEHDHEDAAEPDEVEHTHHASDDSVEQP